MKEAMAIKVKETKKLNEFLKCTFEEKGQIKKEAN